LKLAAMSIFQLANNYIRSFELLLIALREGQFLSFWAEGGPQSHLNVDRFALECELLYWPRVIFCSRALSSPKSFRFARYYTSLRWLFV
jgi:hypothetical protein